MLSKLATRVHRAVGEPAEGASLSSRRREVRFRELTRRFPRLAEMRVLDLGGTPDFWRKVPVRPAFVTTMNLDEYRPAESWLEHVVGDACLQESLQPCSGDYDLVVSNSLIEHVGGFQRRLDLANIVMAAAPRFWVQTPDRYFPIEPHYIAPAFQFLPPRGRAAAVQYWPLGHDRVHTRQEALEVVFRIDLISASELGFLLPGADIWHERYFGLSKSIVAVKSQP